MGKSRETKVYSNSTLACFGAVLLSIFLYLYFLNVSVVHVVMRKDAIREINNLNTEIAMLESAYIEAEHTITTRIATLDGYNADTKKVFLNTSSDSLVLNQ